ncbi:MAG TPA: cytochrome bc complex cytochrome b subunit [Thermoleophilia bacterium]|nr:cytochrome bc complex cytochrome b subunit [Thermoleophilia bacterium]
MTVRSPGADSTTASGTTGATGEETAVRPRGLSGHAAAWIDGTVGGARALRRELRHIFPDHWSFFLGEIAMYSFLVLIATGIFLALFFRASGTEIVYEGSYAPLQGVEMTEAYASTLDLSFDVRGGLLMRQIHHWAALVFVAALVLHLFRMLFTGAYRRPRRLNWVIGLVLVQLVIANGIFGYSLPDDLLSGIGLRIAYSFIQAIPLLGPWVASVLFGGEFPTEEIITRIYPVHIFLVPAAIATLLAVHLGALWLQRHTQFPGPGRDQRTVVGTPLVPAYALRTVGFALLVAGGLAAMGGLLQINPLWLWGPYRAADATTMAQPDWYTTWLEGGLRLFPGWDLQIGGFLLPALFWPALVLPGILFTALVLWPWIDAAFSRDRGFHNLLHAPCGRPLQAATTVGVATALLVLLIAGGNDVLAVLFGVNQPAVLRILQGQAIALPPVAAMLAYAVCRGFSRAGGAAGQAPGGATGGAPGEAIGGAADGARPGGPAG